MTESSSYTVTFVQRKPVPGRHHSLERVFDAVRAGLPPGVKVQRVLVPRSGIAPIAMLLNIWSVRSVRSDVIHVTGDVHYVVPFLRRPSVRVLTIHDLASLNRTAGLRRLIIRLLWFTWPLRKVDAVSVVSEETRRQLIREVSGARRKVTVVGNPLTSPFTVEPRTGESPPSDVSSCVVLAIGTGENKNLKRIAEAVHQVGASLRIIGRLGADTARHLERCGVRYEAVDSLSDDALLTEYLKADVLAFPSLHEGFGLPIVEAQAVGLPVITSNAPPMSDVAAGGAMLVDPRQVSEIADALRVVLQDAKVRARLRADGLRNAKKYSPQAISAMYARLYEDQLSLRDGR